VNTFAYKAGLAVLLLVGASIVSAANTAGQITHLSGVVSVKRSDGSSKVLSLKSEIQAGDVLSTQQDTYARVKFADGGEVVMRPSSQLKVESFAFNEAKPESDNMVLGLLKGGLRAVTGLIGKRNRDKVSYNTPTATIGIRGTHFGALYCNNDCDGVATPNGKQPANGLHLDVSSGAVSVTNQGGEATFQAGQFGFVKDAITPPAIKPPEDNLQVTMPPAISENKGTGKSGTGGCTYQ
jgi:hypothetical protein